MTFQEIRENLNLNRYTAATQSVPEKLSKNHVFDKNMSVAWNEEQYAAYNTARETVQKQNRQAQTAADNLFADDIRSALQTEYNLNDKQASLIFVRAYDDGHAYGHYEVIAKAESFGELTAELLKHN